MQYLFTRNTAERKENRGSEIFKIVLPESFAKFMTETKPQNSENSKRKITPIITPSLI